MNATKLVSLNGKKALMEVREGRRSHRLVVARLEKDGDRLIAVYHDRYLKQYPAPWRVEVPEVHIDMFESVLHRDYDLRFLSVLHRHYVESDDTVACARPPIIVTQAEIDAARDVIP